MKDSLVVLFVLFLCSSCFMGHHNAFEQSPRYKPGVIEGTFSSSLEFSMDIVAFVINVKATKMTESQMAGKAIAARCNTKTSWIDYYNACEMQSLGCDIYECSGNSFCYAVICVE